MSVCVLVGRSVDLPLFPKRAGSFTSMILSEALFFFFDTFEWELIYFLFGANPKIKKKKTKYTETGAL